MSKETSSKSKENSSNAKIRTALVLSVMRVGGFTLTLSLLLLSLLVKPSAAQFNPDGTNTSPAKPNLKRPPDVTVPGNVEPDPKDSRHSTAKDPDLTVGPTADFSPSSARPFGPTVSPLTVSPSTTGPSNDWVTYGWDVQRTGYNPTEVNSSLGPTTAHNLHQLWASNLGGVMNAQPVYAHNVNVNGTTTDILYIGTEDGVFHAVNAATGIQIWSRQLGAEQTSCSDLPSQQFGITSTAVLDRGGSYGDRVYVVDGLGKLYALNLADGTILPGWPINILDPGNKHVYGALNLFKGNIYAVAASYCDQGQYHGRALEVSNVTTSTPTLNHQFLPTGATGTHYGAGIWGIGGASVDPNSNNVYVAVGNALPPDPQNYGYAERIVRLDLSLNVVSSNYAPLSPNGGDSDYGATPLLYNPSNCSKSLLAAENKAGNMPVYDRYNLHIGPLQDFQIAPTSGSGQFIGLPAFSPQTNYVYVSNPASQGIYTHGLVAFQVKSDCTLNPSPIWQSTVGNNGNGSDDPYSPPTVANGVAYMADGLGGDLFAFDAQNGGPPLWTASGLHPAFTPPIVVDGRVFIGTYSNMLYSYSL